MVKQISVALAAVVLLAAGVGLAEGPATMPAATRLEKQEGIVTAAEKSLVIVEYTLQYDKGEAPSGAGDVIREERPLEEPGILVGGNHVVTDDLQIHPRFIKSIAVRRFADANKSAPRVAAKVSGYPRTQACRILELAGPLEGAQPAEFDAKREGPLSVVSLVESDGTWGVQVQGMANDLAIVNGRKLLESEARGLVVDGKGMAVGVLPQNGPVLVDGSWKGDPLQWPMISNDEMSKSLAALNEKATKGIVRVMLNFRSPKGVTAEDSYRRPGVDPNATVQYVLGVMIDDQRVLVLTEMKPRLTARLERIKVFTDPPVEAKFVATLSDYGALVADLEKPATGAGLGLSKTNIHDVLWQEAPSAEVFLQGEKRVSYVQPLRIENVNVGWRRHVYPEIPSEIKGSENGRGAFVFDSTGALAAFLISVRQKASTEERYGGESQQMVTPVDQIAAVLADLPANSDKDNVPLSEEEENRIAWVGLEMQPLNQELARANNVSDQTNDGETGGIVTYVYPDSPAGKAGVEPGWVLLRIDAEGQPKPIDVHVDADPFSEQPFPWERFDEVPEAWFDRIYQVTPWPRAGSSVVRAITEVGFGKKYTMEFFHDGKVDKKEFAVKEGPAHFDNAPKYKQPAMGLTVKDVTYEVRRYMQMKPEDPGVIVAKIELGSVASKAGIKPYEVITHVNDQPVLNVKDFARLTKGQTEVRLSVKRMMHGRIVKMTLGEGAGTQPATAPAK